MSEWYYAEGGKPAGPVPRAELEDMLRSGALAPETKVCAVGGTAWVRAQDVPGLTAPVAAHPPPLAREAVAAPSSPGIARPRPREGFKPHWSVWVLLALTIALTLAVGLRRGIPDDAFTGGRLVGQVIATVFFPLLLGLLAYHLARRSRAAGSLVAGALLLLMVTAQALVLGVDPNAVTSGKSSRAAFADLEAKQAAVREAARKELAEKGEIGDATRAKSEEVLTALETAAASAEGEDAKCLEVSAAHARELQDKANAYMSRVNAFIAAGGFDPSTLSDREAIVQRLAMIRAVVEDNQTLQRATANFLGDLEERLVREGVRAETAAQFRKGASTTFDGLTMLGIRKQDAGIWAAGKGMLEILRDNFGHWGYEAGSDLVLFDESVGAEVIDEYSSLGQEIQELAAAQQELQAKAFSEKGKP